ncbi:MAG: hypothetical protein LBV38_04075 [Alistipes sp.]|jgi:hypothetical protein|nr:hypothetical protein [Alistipes sp.]
MNTRIYYKEGRSCGQPIVSSVIDEANFDLLMRCPKPQSSFELAPDGESGFRDHFRHIQIDAGYRDYSASEGSFHLPPALIFCDDNDALFPSLFYFVARIDGRLEVCVGRGGGSAKWFQIGDSFEAVTDNEVISRMENSIEGILAFLKNYKEPEKPEKRKITGRELKRGDVVQLINLLTGEAGEAGGKPPKQSLFSKIRSSVAPPKGSRNGDLADAVVKMAASPTDYFDSNEAALNDYQIFDPSGNMYLLYLAGVLEERHVVATVDWKDGLDEVLFALKSICDVAEVDIDRKKFARKSTERIFSLLSEVIETKMDKTLFILDTDSDSYTFGLIEKGKMEELAACGKRAGIEIHKI